MVTRDTQEWWTIMVKLLENPEPDVARISWTNANYSRLTAVVEDGSFIRVRTSRFIQRLQTLCQNKSGKRFRATLGTDIATITILGYDPEVVYVGRTSAYQPAIGLLGRYP